MHGSNRSVGIQRFLFKLLLPVLFVSMAVWLIPGMPVVAPAIVVAGTVLLGAVLWLKRPPHSFQRSVWPAVALAAIAVSVPLELVQEASIWKLSVGIGDVLFCGGILGILASLRPDVDVVGG